MNPLVLIGWNDFFASQLDPETGTGLTPGRVSGGAGRHLLVHDGVAERPAVVPGRLAGVELAAGDWVLLDGAAPAVVVRRLERRSALQRQAAGRATAVQALAANVDLVVVLEALDRPESPRRLERLVALAWSAGAEPLVLLTKADRHPDPAAAERAAAAVSPGVEVHAVVSDAEATRRLLTVRLDGRRTAVLVGLSGVGKSTLTNGLLGREARRTGEVRDSDSRGRHTTSDRRLFPVPGGGCLVDGPGVRELALWDGGAGIERAFADIAELADGCRFADCRHAGEPGCAVGEAVAAGLLDVARVDGWARLRRELEVQELRAEGRLRAEERRRWRSIHKSMRHLTKG